MDSKIRSHSCMDSPEEYPVLFFYTETGFLTMIPTHCVSHNDGRSSIPQRLWPIFVNLEYEPHDLRQVSHARMNQLGHQEISRRDSVTPRDEASAASSLVSRTQTGCAYCRCRRRSSVRGLPLEYTWGRHWRRRPRVPHSKEV